MTSSSCCAMPASCGANKKTPDPEIFRVADGTHQVCCNGGGGALGHPRVYYTFDGKPSVTCGYCDRVFTTEDVAGAKPWAGA